MNTERVIDKLNDILRWEWKGVAVHTGQFLVQDPWRSLRQDVSGRGQGVRIMPSGSATRSWPSAERRPSNGRKCTSRPTCTKCSNMPWTSNAARSAIMPRHSICAKTMPRCASFWKTSFLRNRKAPSTWKKSSAAMSWPWPRRRLLECVRHARAVQKSGEWGEGRVEKGRDHERHERREKW